MNIAGVLARILSITRTKMVITQHNPLAGELSQDGRQYRVITPAYRILRPFIDAAVAVSDGIAQELVELAGFPEKKVERIYNAVTGPWFETCAAVPVHHPWFCDDNPTPVLISAARLVPQKDHQTLLRAVALCRRTSAVRLLVLGAGPLRERLRNLAYDLQIADSVDFVGFQENPLPWMRRADVFVLSSRVEGFGIALAEALGCGTPVISTDGYGPSEIIDRGRYGVLVPPEDPVALAAALSAVGDMRRRFPPELLKARAAEFSEAACANGYLSLFRRLTRQGA
jgi:glycosyltransferase involved in cell wall biosynthesis